MSSTDSLTFGAGQVPHSSYNFFGVHIRTQNDSAFLITRDRNNNIVSFSLDNKQSDVLLPANSIIGDYSAATIIRDTMFVFDGDSLCLHVFRFTDNRLTKCAIKDFSKTIDRKVNVPDLAYVASIEVLDHTLWTPYRIWDAGKYWMDSTTFLGVSYSLDADTLNKLQKWWRRPDDYAKGYFRNTTGFLRRVNDSICLMGYSYIDSLTLINYKTGKMVKTTCFNPCSRFMHYDWKLSEDLGYSRWYDATLEENINILEGEDRILVIKRLSKKEIKELSVYEYYYLDNSLQLLKHGRFTHAVAEQYCFPYQHGFLLFDDKRLKAWYYDKQ